MRARWQTIRSVLGPVFNGSHNRTSLPSFPRRWVSVKSRQWSTPLAKNLANAIEVTGPITVAAFMRQCLTSPDAGYYTNRRHDNSDQFGQKGDFVTSPEISQVFGELIGIWFVAEWMAQGKRSSGVAIMEVGPGRGTLMDDMLRTIEHFQPMASSIDAIYMVEASPSLREAQKNLLCGDSAELREIDIGFESSSKYLNGVKIVWTEDIRLIEKDSNQSPFIVAHEFFDALPIHIFQSIQPSMDSAVTSSRPVGEAAAAEHKTSNQWRELVITPAADPDPMAPDLAAQLPEFELSLSKLATPHSLYLPETSDRYKAQREIQDSIIEVSPESQAHASDFATRIGGSSDPSKTPIGAGSSSSSKTTPFLKEIPSGAALIIDYGPSNAIPTNSLRGIVNHERVSPLRSPGAVDVSVDVDFTALAHAALDASPNVVVHGPLGQGAWLRSMGIQERVQKLMQAAQTRAQSDRIQDGWQRLTASHEGGMGNIYKVMAILPYKADDAKVRRPVGFGGDVVMS